MLHNCAIHFALTFDSCSSQYSTVKSKFMPIYKFKTMLRPIYAIVVLLREGVGVGEGQ